MFESLDCKYTKLMLAGSDSLEDLRRLESEVETIASAYPQEYMELASMVEQLTGMASAGTVTPQEIGDIVGTLYHALHHIKTYSDVVTKLSVSKVCANALAEEIASLSPTVSTVPIWGRPIVQAEQGLITHISAVIVDHPHTMFDNNHPYTRYRIIFKSDMPGNSRYYMVYRRFNDIKRLAAALTELKLAPTVPLPPQRSGFQSIYDPIFIEDRRRRLVEYLQSLSSTLSIVQTPIFQEFITRDGQYRAADEGYT